MRPESCGGDRKSGYTRRIFGRISIKAALGRLQGDPREIVRAIEPAGFCHLPVRGLHAAAVPDLAPVVRVPFDRMLMAQALCEPMIVLTNDAVLAGYGPFVTVA